MSFIKDTRSSSVSTLLNAEFVTTNMTVPAKMISVMPSTLPSCPAAGSVEYFVLNWKKSFSLIPMSAVPMTIIKINIPKNTCTLRYAARRPSGSLGKRKLTKPKRSWRERQRKYDQFSWAEVIKTNRTNCLASHNSVKQSISRICGFNEFHLRGQAQYKLTSC